ncbi:GNAT family N-acetyltransferase [Bradyrhizobium sp. LA6.10]|uniref:GNAT family N-acetyltransferase n=1 Tax=Bradyrhizobium sp. LA6.10 TaxID=3156318 RepID=UPI003398066D
MYKVSITRVPLSAVVPLRTSELRPKRHPKDTITDGDLLSDSIHVAAVSQDQLLGVASAVREPAPPPLGGAAAWRVRGVAVIGHFRGTGVGRQLVEAACNLIADRETSVWLYAQEHVSGFYNKLGFAPVATSVPHHISGLVGLYELKLDHRGYATSQQHRNTRM